ncbi:MAG: cell division protein FtsA [Holosporaceae bacterium]|jgi:cell division protein FtsA|nr:cell division protein FtsA [Holosporaceae bacterium]
MKKNSIITAIDIGSTKVCCFIAHIGDLDNFRILGIGYCLCLGVKSGVIVDMESVERSVAQAVDSAEKMANFRSKSAYVSISGKNVESKIVSMTLNLGGKIITEDDLLYLFSNCDKEVDQDREVIHSIPVLYSVDSLNCIKDPLGMFANQLTAKINLVTVTKPQLHNVLLCLERCHLDVVGIVAVGYAAGLCVIDEADMPENQIVIDFGGGNTSIAFFYNGVFCGSDTVPLGGKNITNDIAYGLNISIANAERLKTLHGAAFTSMTDNRDMIFAPMIEDSDIINLQQIPKSALNHIIQPRVEEILIAVRNKIDGSAFGADFSRSVTITGGGSLITGLRDFASGILNKKVKFKKMEDFLDGSDVQISNNFSVAFGIIKFAQLNDYNFTKTKSLAENREKIDFWKKMLNWIENNL